MANLLEYEFSDESLLRLAFTHRSAGAANNERLEFLGDAVLGQVIADYLYREFPQADEGQLTRTRALLVNRTTLASVARRLDLGGRLVLGEGELKSGGWRRDSILANTLEAVIGAIYLDGGLQPCVNEISRWFAQTFAALDPTLTHKDAKTRLQEYLQGRGRPLPVYTSVEVSGPAHDQRFTIECSVDGEQTAVTASGKSRRIGEQRAAAKMLERLERHDER